jgi:hypothetical protein
MRDFSVVDLMPSRSAAPRAPVIWPRAFFSATRIFSRSRCSRSSSVKGKISVSGAVLSIRARRDSEPASARLKSSRSFWLMVMARSIIFCSSRKLPGQSYARSSITLASLSCGWERLYRLPSSVMKCAASNGISFFLECSRYHYYRVYIEPEIKIFTKLFGLGLYL